MAILECRLVFFSYEYDGGGFGSEERSQAGLLEVIDVLIFARRQILEGRLITHVCIKGTINSSCPVVVVHSLVHRCSSQPQNFVSTSRLVLRSKMFSKLWLVHLSSIKTFIDFPENLVLLPSLPLWPQHSFFKFLRTRRPGERLPSSGPMSPTIRTSSFSVSYVPCEHLDLF